MPDSSRASSNPSFTRAFWKAKKVVPFNPYEADVIHRWGRIGYSYHHRVPRSYDTKFRMFRGIDDITASVVEVAHTTTVYMNSVLDSSLYRIYMLDNQLGGKADPNWAWRPGIWWTFCEQCETLWHMPYEVNRPLGIMDIFPLNYWPGDAILATLRTRVWF